MKILMALLLTGCGSWEMSFQDHSNVQQTEQYLYQGPVQFEGYLLSAFNITVDGEHYADSEDFYTNQLVRLNDLKNEAGYEEYMLELEASIGLDDLKSNMRVFIAPSASGRGYAAETFVNHEGKFQAIFPAEAEGDTVKIRANKRINIRLVDPLGEYPTITWCYNFFAQEMNMVVSRNEKPIVLDTFYTRVTSYQCQSVGSSGLTIPNNPARSGSNQAIEQHEIEQQEQQEQQEIEQ
jgi:hypothetical protein